VHPSSTGANSPTDVLASASERAQRARPKDLAPDYCHLLYKKPKLLIMNIIRLNEVGKSYQMGLEVIHALKSITLDIAKNEYVALMGPSGSGKSTLMNILGCLDSPGKGSYVLNGHDVSGMADEELAAVRNKQIGFVFQTFNLLPRMSSLENVALPLVYAGMPERVRLEKAAHVLESVGLKDRMKHKPNELSGGQRQRVAVARALVNDPAIILADEPTGNLDSRTSIEIMALFEQIHNQGNTVILVTHEPDIALHAHRIVRLRDGLVEDDKLNEEITRAALAFEKLAALRQE
jgi:putative ABC transport system ATP-binding protein